jgi:hypothetical protein
VLLATLSPFQAWPHRCSVDLPGTQNSVEPAAPLCQDLRFPVEPAASAGAPGGVRWLHPRIFTLEEARHRLTALLSRLEDTEAGVERKDRRGLLPGPDTARSAVGTNPLLPNGLKRIVLCYHTVESVGEQSPRGTSCPRAIVSALSRPAWISIPFRRGPSPGVADHCRSPSPPDPQNPEHSRTHIDPGPWSLGPENRIVH